MHNPTALCGNPAMRVLTVVLVLLTMEAVCAFVAPTTQFYGLRKIGVLGKPGAHKVMLMAAIAFNLKKYLKKGERKPSLGIFKTVIDALQGCLTIFLRQIQSRPVLLKAP